MREESIHTLDQIADICSRLREDGKRIAHCHGAFDLMHPGHVRHLRAARELADVLVVTLTEDRFIRKGPGRPVFNERLRAETVAAVRWVDHVATCPFPTGVEAIEAVKAHVYVKGQEYRDRGADLTGAIVEEEQAVAKHGGELVFTNEFQFSSTKLLNEFFTVLSDEQRAYLRDLRTRYAAGDVLAMLDRLKTTKVLVVGEAIIDEYRYCIPDAMSNKSPTLSVRFESDEIFAGGVVAVGNHLAGLCGSVKVLAGAGDGSAGTDAVVPYLADGVTACVVSRPDAPTVRKRRFVHRFLNQKLFEVTFLDDRPIDDGTQAAFLSAIDAHAPAADVVIVVDFGHGFFTPPIVQRLRDRAKFLAVNAQINSSNRGFNSIRKYKGADYISVDEHEIRLPFGDRYGPLANVAAALSRETGCHKINVTLGDKGTAYFADDVCHAAPVFTSRVVDAIGAGDALLAATALMVHSGAPAELVAFIGNCMGALMTQIVGHRQPVDAIDLYKFVGTLLK